MNKNSFLLIGLLCIALLSCNKQAPQLPSNKVVVDNSDAKTLLLINQNLATREDSILELLVTKKYKSFLKNETGFWYKVVETGNGKSIKNNSKYNIRYSLQLINGKEVETGKKEFVVGKKEIIIGLEEGIKLLHEGDSATIIIPWYLGYGMKGSKDPYIPSYSSIIYQIRILN